MKVNIIPIACLLGIQDLFRFHGSLRNEHIKTKWRRKNSL